MAREEKQTARAPKFKRAPGTRALSAIFAPRREEREGWRHGFLGDSGTGKSYATRALVDAAVADGQILMAHDDCKLDPQYPGLVAEHPDSIPDGDGCGVVFRGNPWTGRVVEVEDVATLALKVARGRVPCVLVVDELDRACTEGGQQLKSPSLRTCLTQGRSIALSVAWTTQSPARAPKEVLDQATSIGLFRLGPRALNYLDERLYFDPEMLEVIPTLARGEFVLWRSGHQWDRLIYRF